ncbi:MAG TPA: 4-hydroxythreonine-4-phosphate dehydrogenase PdxA [Desulfuromonadales bacterium]|nr:4-hydroxythreonine-4-phosphate dehydrogenase PdxA [Desulfuromonadales bacterium]
MPRPLIITMGDPAGIGPEIIIQAFARQRFADMSRPLVVAGDPEVLMRAAAACRFPARSVAPDFAAENAAALLVNDVRIEIRALSRLPPSSGAFGQPDASGGRAMADCIEWACAECLAGHAAGMVTAPINKEVLRAVGYAFPGHTELLTARCKVAETVMMLAGERLKVGLATTHCAYRDVPGRLTRDRILAALRIVAADLERYFGCARPRLAVAALNPHAGEGGLFGDEEHRLIGPAIDLARRSGIDAAGPFSADTLFWFAARGDYDAVLCMYHDQGLIPLKLLHFEDAVNITLGLPIIRTSVDHGTAYDLAGTGRANPASLVAAVRTAAIMARGKP